MDNFFGSDPGSLKLAGFSFEQEHDCWLGYNEELDEYVFADKTTNLPVYFFILDENGQPIVRVPTPKDLGITTLAEEINVLPFLNECLKKGLPGIPNQFKEVRKEIKGWLKQNYGIKPQPEGFIDWYIQSRLTPFIKANPMLEEIARYFASRKVLPLMTGEIYLDSTSLPQITQQDVQEYCYFKKQGLDTYDQELHRSVSSPDLTPKAKPIITFQWLGPTTDKINQLDALYDVLSGTYLDSSIEVFRGAFGKGSFMGPVNWKEKTSVLIWLILELQNHDFLDRPAKQSWQTLANTFVVANNKLAPNQLKVLKKNLDLNLRLEAKVKISQLVAGLD